MSSFTNAATAGGSSYIQQNLLFPPGPLPVSAVQGTADPVVMSGNFKFDRIEADQLVSGATELYIPRLVSTSHVNLAALSRSPTTTINSATGVTITMAQFKSGCIVRQGLLAGSVTDNLPSGAAFVAELLTAGTTRMECLFMLEFRSVPGASVTFSFPADCAVDSGYRRVFTSAGNHQMVLVQYELITNNLATPPNVRVRLVSQSVLTGGAQAYLELLDVSPYVLLRETSSSKELTLGIDAATTSNYLEMDAAYPLEFYHGAANTFRFLSNGQFRCTGGFNITGSGTLSGTLGAGATTVTALTVNGNASVTGTLGAGTTTLGATSVTSMTNSGNMTVSGNGLLRGPTFMKFTVSSALTTDGNLTFTAADVVNGFIRRDLSASTASRTDTFPTAASLVSTYGLAVGDSFQVLMELATASAGGWTYNCQPGTGGTIIGFTSVTTNTKVLIQWRIIMTNVGSGTEAYYMIRHGFYNAGFTTFV